MPASTLLPYLGAKSCWRWLEMMVLSNCTTL